MEFVPGRLRDIRILKDCTLESVAEKVGITKQAVSKYETGSMIPADKTLTKLLDLFGITPDYLTNKMEYPSEKTIVFYRKEKRTPQKELDEAEVYLKYAYEIIMTINKICPVQLSKVPSFPIDSTIKAKAEMLRHAWGLGEEPIADIVSILERRGFYFFSLYMTDKRIDGFSQMIGDVPIIFLNAAKGTKARRCFSVVHELGHLMLHRGMKQMTDLMEREADEFAGCFLMPESSIRREMLRKDADSFIRMSEKWRVSPQALVERCNNLQLLGQNAAENDAKRSSLYQNISRKMKAFAEFKADDAIICSVRAILYCIEADADMARNFLQELHFPIMELQRLCGMADGFAKYKQSDNEDKIDGIGGVQLRFNF